jgi:uncharacterized protein (DUF58 family)
MNTALTSDLETAQGNWVDPATLMRIKHLHLRAKAIVQGFYSGLHRSPFHGFSAQFSEYRQYSPGDDPRYIDWKLYARSDRHYIKRFEDETNLRCYLLVDRSRSMQYGSLAYTKTDYSSTLAATFAYFLNSQRDAVGLLTFDQAVREYLPARFRPGHFNRLLVGLERPCQGKTTHLEIALKQVAELTRRRGLVVLISDMLSDLVALQESLSLLRSIGHEVIVFQVLDPQEIEFNLDQAAMFEDLETGRKMYVDPAAARRQYLERFSAHQQSVLNGCQDLGIDYRRMLTNEPLETAMFDFVRARMSLMGRTFNQHRRAGGA